MSILDHLTIAEEALRQIRQAVSQPQPTVVKSGEALQPILDRGGIVQLEPAAVFEAGRFALTKPTRLIFGAGSRLHGTSGPGFFVTPGTTDIAASDSWVTSDYQAAYQFGENGGGQTRLEDVPRRIHLVHPMLPSHHGPQAKNGIENNGAEVGIEDAEIRDVFNPGGVESHCLATLNTPGGLRLLRGTYSGGSTVLFSGGDTIKLPDTDIADVVYDSLTITRPASWQTDGVNRNIKNLVEFKNVSHALVTNCDLSNNWGPIQRGFAFMCTPKVDGRVVDVELRGNRVSNVGGFANITGRNPTGQDVTRTDDIRILGNTVTIDKTAYGPSAYGWFLLLQDGPGRIVVEGNTVQHNGNAFIVVDDMDPIESLIVRGNTFNAGSYGIKTPAGNNGTNWQQVFRELVVTDNTISGASAVFQRNFPENRYV